jgi:hypothetical protein
VIPSILAEYFYLLSNTTSRAVFILYVQSTCRVVEGGIDLHWRRREGSLSMCPTIMGGGAPYYCSYADCVIISPSNVVMSEGDMA